MPQALTPARHDLLLRLATVGDLGPEAPTLAHLIHQVSQGAWSQRVGTPRQGGLNGGSPLEISASSDQRAGFRYTTSVGAPSATAMERLHLGLAGFARLVTTCLGEGHATLALLPQIQAAYDGFAGGRGEFGCYLGGSHQRGGVSRLKLYLELFERQPQPALHQWQQVLQHCGVETRDSERLEELLSLATPTIGCLEQASDSLPRWRLYWRIHTPTPDTLGQIAAAFGVDPAFAPEVSTVFRQAAGGPTGTPPVTGFVHPLPLLPGCLGFYSGAPARWACTPQKRQQMTALWQQWGGNRALLHRTWRLCQGSQSQSWLPTLTILGLGIVHNRYRRAQAYFRPSVTPIEAAEPICETPLPFALRPTPLERVRAH